MAIDYLSYTKKGFLPAPKDDDNSFIARSDKVIDCSEQLRRLAAGRDQRLERILSGTSGMFNLNPFHDLACKYIYATLGMHPAHFVGLHADITKVMRKDTPHRKRIGLLGVCESLNIGGSEVPAYIVSDRYRHPEMVSVHELYHCIMRAQEVWPWSPIRAKIDFMIEEFRSDLLMTGEDINVDYKLKMINNNLDKIRSMVSKGEIKVPHSLEQLLNRSLVRKSVYMAYQHNYEKQTYSSLNLTGKTMAAIGSLALGMLNPLLTANLIAQLFLATGGFAACSVLYGIYSNYRVAKANSEAMDFMAYARESLNDEFGTRGANFMAYTLYHPEMREMARYGSAKDYLYKKGTTRSKALLEHAVSL